MRSKMRDFPEMNTLFDGEDNSTEEILDAIDIVLSRITDSPPPLGLYTVQRTPIYLLLDGVIAELLESGSILLMRNYLQFSTGGFTIDPPQYMLYRQWASEYYQRFRSELNLFKVAENHQRAVDGSGGLFSDWIIVNRPTRYLFNDVLRGSLLAA